MEEFWALGRHRLHGSFFSQGFDSKGLNRDLSGFIGSQRGLMGIQRVFCL